MAAPPEIERAANQAAIKVKKTLIAMMMANQLGSVTIEVTPAGLQPIRRIEDRDRIIRTGKGVNTLIESI